MKKIMFLITMMLVTGGIMRAEDQDVKKAEQEEPWKVMTGEEFLKVTKGRCPIIWQINPNDPGYDAMVREKAASGGLIITAPRYLKSEHDRDMEGGPLDSWKRYYRNTHWDTMGWEDIEPPVKIPRQDFPIRYERTFTDEHIDRVADDGILFYSYASGIEGKEARAIAMKCREKLGDKFIVMRQLEATNAMWAKILSQVRKAGLDPSKMTRKECFALARGYAQGRIAGAPKGFGFGASNVKFMQVIDVGELERWDMELANGSRQVELTYCRGAKQQYDVPFVAYVACMSTSKDGIWGRYLPADTPYERYFRFAYGGGGKPAHLINRTFWVAWFYDADSLVGEAACYWCFVKGKDDNTFELSELGKDLKKLYRFADTDFFDRGEPYTPACILLDYCNGWEPALSTDAHGWDPPGFLARKIWGVMDFKKRDIMIDNFFGAILPGYEMAACWGNPYGDLVNTPYGDSFDTMLSNASEEALKKYKVVFTVGEPEMTEGLFGKLSEYVKSGGDLVLNATDLTDQWKDLMGIKMNRQENRWYKGPGMLRVSDSSQWLNEEPVKEKRYFYYIIEGLPGNAVVLAKNPERDQPIIAKIPVGKGNVYFTAIQNMQECSGIYRPYGITKCCKDLIKYVLDPYQKVFVDGEPIEYIVRQKGNRLLVMVVNNRDEPWKGKLTFVPFGKKRKYKLNEWYVNSEPVPVAHEVVDGKVEFEDEIAANDLKLYTLE